MKINFHTKLLITLIIISFLIFLSLAIYTETQWAQDSHWHMSLAKSFASGKGYSFDGLDSPHGKYPPGLTLLISPFFLIFQNVQLAGLIAIGILSLLSIYLIYKIGSLQDKKIGLFAAVFLAFHNLFVFNSVSIMTEIPFMFFSLASIYLFIRGFENQKLFFPSLLFFSIASLIRYDGIFILPVFIFYAYTKRKQLKDINLNGILLGILSILILLGGWFIRNWINFGSPLYSAYTQELASFNILEYLSFIWIFFKTGYIFPIIVIIGLYFFLKENNSKLKPFLIWFLIYIAFHMYWSTRVLRFYVEILPLLCLFASYGVFGITQKLKLNRKKLKIVLSLILIFFIISQSLMFFVWSKGESGLITLNRYNSIKEISLWANENLPDDSIYAVSDYAVYSLYLEKPNIGGYNQGINFIFQNQPVYILTDTLHPWATGPFMEGKTGEIKLSLNEGTILLIETELLKKAEHKNREAIILKSKEFSIN